MRLEDDYDVMGRWQRKVSFFDARSNSEFVRITGVPAGKELFPFVIPEDQSVPLRVVPVPAKITLAGEQVEQKISFQERYKGLIDICCWFVIVVFVILSWKTDRHGK